MGDNSGIFNRSDVEGEISKGQVLVEESIDKSRKERESEGEREIQMKVFWWGQEKRGYKYCGLLRK